MLAGGFSRRMKEDKGNIVYHQKAQREHIADVLAPFCNQVFISCRKTQEIKTNYTLLFDQYDGIGPMSALLSAFQQNAQVAWLVIACDMPLMNAETVAFLIKNRDVSKVATAFQHPISNQIEPFAAIWEANCYLLLTTFFENGHKSPVRFLKENDIQTIYPRDKNVLLNVNRPEERKSIQHLLKELKR